MGVNLVRLQRLVDREGERGQAKAARRMRIAKSTLSRLLGDRKAATEAEWRTVARMAAGAGVPFTDLWDGPVPPEAAAELNVPRGTSGAPGRVREVSPPYGTAQVERARNRVLIDAARRLSTIADELLQEATYGMDR